MLTSQILRIPTSEFLKSFEICIQLGAIAAALVLYWRKLLLNFKTIKNVAIAFLPSAIFGLLFYKLIKGIFLESTGVVLWSLFLGGLFLIIFDWRGKKREEKTLEVENITARQALVIGMFQVLSLVPGVSRAAATIVGGLVCKISRRAVVEFSFLLAIPTMAAATGYDLVKSAGLFSGADFWVLAVGFVMSFVTAILGIKFLVGITKKHTFVPFCVYRVVVALVFFLIFF